jgi:hypothetical protein
LREEYANSLDWTDDLGYWGVGAASVGLGTEAVTAVVDRAAKSAINNAKSAPVNAGGSIWKKLAVGKEAQRLTVSLTGKRAVLGAVSKGTGGIGGVATVYSATARAYCLLKCGGGG